MILLRDTVNNSYGDTEGARLWSEQKKVEDIDSLIETMSEALEGDENAPKPRSYEVIEVQVVRRTTLARRVQTNVLVDVTEGEEDADD